VLAADAELKVGAGRAAARGGDGDELADAFGVQSHERIGLQEADTRRWFLPSIEYLGKLGQPNGPSLAAVLELAEMRKTFLAGLPPTLEIEGPPEPPAPPKSLSSADVGLPIDEDEPLDGPPEPPPYERNPNDGIDNVDGAWNR
jgi:hypothetical protein